MGPAIRSQKRLASTPSGPLLQTQSYVREDRSIGRSNVLERRSISFSPPELRSGRGVDALDARTVTAWRGSWSARTTDDRIGRRHTADLLARRPDRIVEFRSDGNYKEPASRFRAGPRKATGPIRPAGRAGQLADCSGSCNNRRAGCPRSCNNRTPDRSAQVVRPFFAPGLARPAQTRYHNNTRRPAHGMNARSDPSQAGWPVRSVGRCVRLTGRAQDGSPRSVPSFRVARSPGHQPPLCRGPRREALRVA